MELITPQELSQQLAAGKDAPVVLDVRQQQEIATQGTIAGAVLIPLNELPARVQELPQGRTIVAVCKSGMRSMNAAQWLAQGGRQAKSMSGGMDAWRALGLPIAR